MNKRIAAGISAGLVAGALAISCISPVTAHADEGNYVGSTEWEQFIDYWHSSLNVAIDDISGGAFDADDIARLNTANFAYASMLYQQYAQSLCTDPETGEIDYSVDIPSGQVACGWYYRANKPHPVVTFGYNQTGDWTTLNNTSVVLVSSDEFTISCNVNLNNNVVYHGVQSKNYDNTWYEYFFNNATISGLSGSGYVSSSGFSTSGNRFIVRAGEFGNHVANLDNVSYTASQFLGYYSSYDYCYYTNGVVDYFGCLKDSAGNPISDTRQKFERASVSNNFPDFVKDLKQDLYDNFPEETVDDIWVEPDTPVEPDYPTDYITGIPKDWTIKNPDIPEYPHIGFDVPDADFSGIQPSEQIEEYTSGIGFWWALTSKMLDVTNMKVIAVLALGLGVLGFVLWHLGR